MAPVVQAPVIQSILIIVVLSLAALSALLPGGSETSGMDA